MEKIPEWFITESDGQMRLFWTAEEVREYMEVGIR